MSEFQEALKKTIRLLTLALELDEPSDSAIHTAYDHIKRIKRYRLKEFYN